jgi:GxxExxY protein
LCHGCTSGIGTRAKRRYLPRSLANHFADRSIAFEEEKLFPVTDDSDHERLVGYYIQDYVVDEKVIVEIKAVNPLDNNNLEQVIGYLAVSALPMGLLINFAERILSHRRVFPPQKVINHLLNRQWLFVPDWLKNQSVT